MLEILITIVVIIALYLEFLIKRKPQVVEPVRPKDIIDALAIFHTHLISLRNDEAAYTILKLIILKNKSILYGYKDRCVVQEIIRTMDIQIEEYHQDVVIPTPTALDNWYLEHSSKDNND